MAHQGAMRRLCFERRTRGSLVSVFAGDERLVVGRDAFVGLVERVGTGQVLVGLGAVALSAKSKGEAVLDEGVDRT